MPQESPPVRPPHGGAAAGPRRIVLALVVVLSLLAAACTGSDDPAPPDTSEAVDGNPGTAQPQDSSPAVATAEGWLRDTYQLDQTVLDGLDVADVTSAMGVTHVRFVQQVADVPVIGGQITVHILESGEVQTATDDLAGIDGAGEASPSVDQARAVDVANKAVTGTPSGEQSAELVWLRNGGRLTLAWRIVVATVDPVSSWTVLIDAGSGAVLTVTEASTGRHDRTQRAPGLAAGVIRGAAVEVAAGSREVAAGSREVAQAGSREVVQADACQVSSPGACVFLPDPIYASGGSLTDRARANDFLAPVELLGLDDASALVGEYVNVEPAGAPVEPTRESDGTWATGRAGRGFEAAMSYYWVDRVQRQLQRLGVTGVLDRPFPVIPIDPGVVDNAFYSPADGAVHLGVGSDGVNEGEDASGIVHEYGHALLDAQQPGLLGGAGGGSYHESFGDLLAFLTTLPERTGDAGCLFAWAEAGQCLRRVDSDKVYPDDLVQEVHDDGEIYNGAIHDVVEGLLASEGLDIAACPGTTDCNATLDRVLATLMVANGYLSNNPSLPDVAETFRLANDAAFAGADAQVIDAAFQAHGLLGGGDQMVDDTGGAMTTGGGVAVAVDISHTYRGDLDVTVGVVDASFTDLCDPVSLFTPDDQDDADDLVGEVDISDTGCAAFSPPGPDQIWYLQAVDTLAEDTGQINGFTVFDDNDPYLAPGLPQPIGDADPDGAFALVDGSGEQMASEGSQGVSDTVEGSGPVLSLDITHTYAGDLDVSAGVVAADSTIICSVPIVEPDPSDSSAGLVGDVDLGECAGFYPPSPSERWYLWVVDTAELDEGTVDAMSLTGPDGAMYTFVDVPVAIPDADVDGVALLLDGTGSASGQAGGGGTAEGLLAVSVDIAHPFQGDLAVTSGVLSSSGDVLCEVVVSAPDPENNAVDLRTETPMTDCSRYYPPTTEQPWYVFAADTLAADVGTVNAAVLVGPDGVIHTAAGAPVDLPDADPQGAVLLFDGSGGSGGGLTPSTDGGGGDVTAVLQISHSYVGDLELNVGVASGDGTVLCEVTVQRPDLSDSSTDLSLEVSMGECSSSYPPSGDAVFYLQAVDTAAQDVGTIEAFSIVGPDGVPHSSSETPLAIPDADPDGAAVGIQG